jgi:lipopolysaccharide transport system permease protein
MKLTPKYEFVIDSKDSVFFQWKELWEYRELFYFFTWRDIKVKYKQTALGFLWVILQPILMVMIFTFFFNRALHLPSNGIPYSVFAFSGLVLWNFFSASVSSAGNSMLGNAHIVKKIYFPRLIIPLSSVIGAAVDMMVGFLAFIALLVWFQIPVGIEAIILWPCSLVIATLASSGLGCLLSAMMIKYRDVRYVIPFMMQAMLFLTPVIYPISMLDQVWAKYLLSLNPMLCAIAAFRAPLMDEQTPMHFLLISAASGLIVFFLGMQYFKRTEKYFADLS